MLDDNLNEEEGRYAPPPAPTPLRPGDPGYRMGPWANDYTPGSSFNNGTPPQSSDPFSNYNGGSPVNAPLAPGSGWEWSGPQTPTWNMTTNTWDQGRWNQVQGRGAGFTPGPTPPPPTGGDGGPRPGAVAPMGGSGINVPSSTLPPDILGLFNKQPEKSPVQSAYQDALLKFMGRSQETPSLNDSILGPQTEVYRAAQQRGQERNRRNVAERAAAHGQSESGYLDNQINKGVQEQNFNTASFNANLLGGEMDKRRNELQAGLQLARATGDAESERELRTRLAQVQAAMQQQGLNLQGQLGAGDLALRQLLGQMGNDQFYDSLGVNTAMGLENLNQKALDIVLNGGR